jgi:hypothetical protein
MNNRQRTFVAIIALSVIVTTATAYPLMNVVWYDNEGGWFTVNNLDDYGDDLETRIDRGEVLLTASPGYVMEANDVHMWEDRPRIHYFLITYKDTRYGDNIYHNLSNDLQSGSIEYVITNGMTRNMFTWNSSAEQAFESNYCYVDDPEAQEMYERRNGNLWQYQENCTTRRPIIE